MRPLRIAALIEAVSLAVLFANLATAHLPAISSTVGPTHGCAYIFVVIAALRAPGADRTARILAFLPGIGGLLVLRRLTAATRPAR